MSSTDGNAIDVPLNAEVRVIDRLNAALQVSVFAFLDILQAEIRKRGISEWVISKIKFNSLI